MTPNSGASAGRSRPDTLARALSRQHGVISLRQAERLGLAVTTVQYRARPGGPWQRIFPGVYLTVSGTATVDQLDMAALLYAGRGGTITGLAALRRFGIRAQQSRVVDVLVPAACGRADRDYVRIHRTVRMPPRVLVQGEIQLTMVPRAVIDAGRNIAGLRDLRAVVAAAVQQRGCTPEQLEAELAQSRLRNAGQLRAVLAEVRAGIRSSPEGDLMDLIKRGGLPTPLYNPRPYVHGRLLAIPDAWWQEVSVAAEVDSRQWHLSPEDWQQTMDRHDRMVAAGIAVLHFSPRRIRIEPGAVISIIRQAIAAGQPSSRIVTKPGAT